MSTPPSASLSYVPAGRSAPRTVTVWCYLPSPPASGLYPIIVFSPGLGASPRWYENGLFDGLTKAGYVVLAATHPGSDDSAGTTPAEWTAAALTPANWALRPQDLREVIKAVSNNPTLAGQLAGLGDPSRIGVAGHSFGAYTALTLAGLTCAAGSFADPTPQAFLAISPQHPTAFGFGAFGMFAGCLDTINRPVMTMAGSLDSNIPYPGTTNLQMAFDRMKAKKNKPICHVTVASAGHYSFADMDLPNSGPPIAVDRTHAAIHQGTAVRAAAAWLDHFLKSNPAPMASLSATLGKNAQVEYVP